MSCLDTISYQETFSRVSSTLYNNSYMRDDDNALRAAVDAIVEYALDHGVPEGVIEKLFQDALR